MKTKGSATYSNESTSNYNVKLIRDVLLDNTRFIFKVWFMVRVWPVTLRESLIIS